MSPALHPLDPIADRVLALMDTLGRQHVGHPLCDLGWSFHFDRARSRLGLCTWSKGGRPVKVISLSGPIARREGWALMEDVARHEVAHAVDFETRGRSAHDRIWKEWARRCGADPSRVYEGELLDDPTSPYVGVCSATGCGYVRPFYRAVASTYLCPRCREAGARSHLAVLDRLSGHAVARRPHYRAVCAACANERHFARKPRLSYACGACCRKHNQGRFDARFLMTIVKRDY